MQQAYDNYAAQYFQNKHVSIWQKLLLFNITVIPNGLYGCVTWDYNEWHLAQIESKQVELLKLILRQQDSVEFDILQAIRIAKNHHWDHTYPVACHIHSTHIKYLRHLLSLPRSSQLYKIIRGKIAHQNDGGYAIFAPLHRPIARTLYFMDVGDIIEHGLQILHEQRRPTIPYAYEQYRNQPRHWTVTILLTSIKDLTFIIKRLGRPRFMATFRRELLRLREFPPEVEEEPNTPDAREEYLSEVSTIRSGISEGDVSVGSHVSDTEEELRDLTIEQLRAYLMTLAPTTIPKGRRPQIIAQLCPIIQAYKQIQHRGQRQMEAHRNILLTDIADIYNVPLPTDNHGISAQRDDPETQPYQNDDHDHVYNNMEIVTHQEDHCTATEELRDHIVGQSLEAHTTIETNIPSMDTDYNGRKRRRRLQRLANARIRLKATDNDTGLQI